MVNGKRNATLSMIRNVAGETISDIIGQFIDGYVDISKGPWIMEMGATPNTAGTWLFLIKLGVPVNTVAYFMNQPIVREYLASVENAGYSWLFIDNLVEEAADNYGGGGIKVAMPDEAGLRKMVGKDSTELSPIQLSQQRLILTEFLKYAKMSSHLLEVTQGSNFDTATINDPYLVFKKLMQLVKARKTIFSSIDNEGKVIPAVDGILDSSFVRILKDTIGDIRNAFSEILVSDKKNVRAALEGVLEPYVNLNDKEFVKLSRKAVNDLFDWAVQTDRKTNNYVKNILLGDKSAKSAATEIMEFKQKVMNDPKHPLHNNLIITSIQKSPGRGEEKVDNLYLTGKDTKVYNQNQLIYAFRELKKSAPAGLYGRMVRLAFLQSGLNNSPISFTSLLPYEDFKELYNETLAKIEEIPNLANFYNLDVFQRNNWSDTNIVPSKKAEWKQSNKTKKWYSKPFNPSEMSFIKKELKIAKQKGLIPEVLNISTLSREGRSKFITFVWEDANYTKDQNVIYESYVYKAINAWGDGFRANELYDEARQSVLDNGYIKVKEVEDGVIEKIIGDKVITKYVNPLNISSEEAAFLNATEGPVDSAIEGTSQTNAQPVIDSSKKINIYAGDKENAELSNFAKRPFETSDGLDFETVEGAFQAAKLKYSSFYRDNVDAEEDMRLKFQEGTGAYAKSLGGQIKGLDTKAWDKDSSSIMKELLKASFEQNLEALQKLLATGNAELTHTQDKSKWGTEFPKLLMEVRDELNPTKEEDPFTCKK